MEAAGIFLKENPNQVIIAISLFIEYSMIPQSLPSKSNKESSNNNNNNNNTLLWGVGSENCW